MSQYLPPVVGLTAGLISQLLAAELGASAPVAIAAFVTYTLVTAGFWMYSPLPDGIGYMSGDAGEGYWGFSKPDAESNGGESA